MDIYFAFMCSDIELPVSIIILKRQPQEMHGLWSQANLPAQLLEVLRQPMEMCSRGRLSGVYREITVQFEKTCARVILTKME
ncbi:hypothetical protein MAR_008751 [Mya arenaria]|uniref:Uncharacterized protein n=1 Tax=Mya arenaria TaxID=6604 RepID=A0ABY7DWT7_MYAAR|nr:hypothetical protein MAR_008751 [Mya arenaria]